MTSTASMSLENARLEQMKKQAEYAEDLEARRPQIEADNLRLKAELAGLPLTPSEAIGLKAMIENPPAPTDELIRRIDRLEFALDALHHEHLPYCQPGPCNPCACRKMGERPHCMYCLNDLSPEMENQWRQEVEACIAARSKKAVVPDGMWSSKTIAEEEG